MPAKRGPRTGFLRAATALVALAALASCSSDGDANDPADTTGSPNSTGSTESSSGPVRLPPVPDGFDYQIGGAYTPPSGVEIVARDRGAKPARGLYNICYVNAFQAQPDELDDWPDDLLLRDKKGEVVIDADWDEALLDIGTPAKRKRVAARVDRWIDGCADKGFDAVEPDNYDSYTRSDGLLNADDAVSFIKLLSQRAHAQGLAIAQKNTVELADRRSGAGLDFAVVEECGAYDECGAYADAFDDKVVVVEYTDKGMKKALAGFGDRLSIVRRDLQVSTPDSDDYIRETG
ncbi:endo alpha-1,4 polygalactosaminidase [Streptomyces sp. NPDC059517]|uniref:endo alpha-1,4 polygalactosaminidase n=1 Tax=Streptomyces sp. NPDC059517 TaxID=3346855 RepID=UPI0036B2AC58